MAYYDSEINVINDFCECDNGEIYLFNSNNEKFYNALEK